MLAGFGARISPTLCCTGGVTCVAGWDGLGRTGVRSLLSRAPSSSRRPRHRGVGGCWTLVHQTQGVHATTLCTRCLLKQAHVSALVYASQYPSCIVNLINERFARAGLHRVSQNLRHGCRAVWPASFPLALAPIRATQTPGLQLFCNARPCVFSEVLDAMQTAGRSQKRAPDNKVILSPTARSDGLRRPTPRRSQARPKGGWQPHAEWLPIRRATSSMDRMDTHGRGRRALATA